MVTGQDYTAGSGNERDLLNIFVDFFKISAYNINEQSYLLDLSASQLRMRTVNFQGDKFLISLFCYTEETLCE